MIARTQWSRSAGAALDLIDHLNARGWLVILKFQSPHAHFFVGGYQGGEYVGSEEPKRRPRPGGVACELTWVKPPPEPYRRDEWAICATMPEAVAKAYIQAFDTQAWRSGARANG